MDKEVKNKVQADLLSSAIALGAIAVLTGIGAGVSGIVCFVHNRKEANRLWSSLTAEDRNMFRQIWFEANQDKDRFADIMYEGAHQGDIIRLRYSEAEDKNKLRIFAKHMRKQLASPMEEIPG